MQYPQLMRATRRLLETVCDADAAMREVYASMIYRHNLTVADLQLWDCHLRAYEAQGGTWDE